LTAPRFDRDSAVLRRARAVLAASVARLWANGADSAAFPLSVLCNNRHSGAAWCMGVLDTVVRARAASPFFPLYFGVSQAGDEKIGLAEPALRMLQRAEARLDSLSDADESRRYMAWIRVSRGIANFTLARYGDRKRLASARLDLEM